MPTLQVERASLSDAALAHPLTPTDMSDLALYTTDRRIIALKHRDKAISITWDDRRESRFDALWLRDNCPCPDCRHPIALERKFLFIDAGGPPLIEHVELSASGAVEVRFSGSQSGAPRHAGRFDPAWLYHHTYSDWARADRLTRPLLWDARLEPDIPTFEHEAVLGDDAVLRRWLEALRDIGVSLIVDGPSSVGEGQRLAERVGLVRETNFGRVFDVESKPNPDNSAYTAAGLEPHTDLANIAYPPDYQLLYCVANEAEGGGSILADGFRVAEELRRVDWDAFALLASRPIEFRFHDESCDLRHRSPVIELDGDGILRIQFNNWLRSAIDLPEALMEPYYHALGKFWGLLRERRFQLRPKLAAGEMLAFDNRRVLHGREPFVPSTGRRHLQGCYLDRDQLESRLRLLARTARGR